MIPFVCTLWLAGGCVLLLGWRSPGSSRPPTRRPGQPIAVVAGGLLGGVLGLLTTTLPVVAALAGIAGGAVPVLWERRRRAQQRRQRVQAWPALLDDVTSAVRAGMTLPEALTRAGRQSPMSAEWQVFDDVFRRTGDFTAAVTALRARVADPVFDQLAQALIVTREVGGTDLTSVLRALGGFVRDELHLRGELEARQSWTVNSARMAVAAPWVVLLMLATRPATIAAYSQLGGVLLLLGVAASSAVAYVAMLRIARLSVVGA